MNNKQLDTYLLSELYFELSLLAIPHDCMTDTIPSRSTTVI